MPEPLLVIGVGNPYRHDDGFGVAVLERLRELAVPGLQVVEESGEPAALIARWSGHSMVILVDAVTSGAEPGSIHHLECGNGVWEVGERAASASTHGLGVADAVELGKLLDQLPARLVILGVETEDVTNGTGLSNAVAAAVDPVATRVAGIASTTAGTATSRYSARGSRYPTQGSRYSDGSAPLLEPAQPTAAMDPTTTETRESPAATNSPGNGSA